MVEKENLQQFYKRICHHRDETLTKDIPHINVFERSSCGRIAPYSRRDYYKVTLIRGKGWLEYADKSYYIDRPAVLFTTPVVPYLWKPEAEEQFGWFCIFNELFAKQHDELLSRLPMFQIGTDKLFFPDTVSEEKIAGFFEQMMEENLISYQNKQDLLRNYLHLIIHEVLKVKPATGIDQQNNVSERITSLFIELLERQFPIDTIQQPLTLKSAKDFALSLSVHTNHLNRAVKEITGETTTALIANRIIVEANDLLRHSNWAIADIAYSLGFEYPAYFNNFYKKHTGITPKETRLTKSLI